jgi:hypothetical protein
MNKKTGYQYAIRWVAVNDEPLDGDPRSIASYISTCLVADLYGYTPEKVAQDIAAIRNGTTRKGKRHG